MIFLDRLSYPYWEEVNEGILKFFPERKSLLRAKVLDVGCGQGALGAAIKAKGYEVWGIESHPEAISKAVPRYDRMIATDLSNLPAVAQELSRDQFDYLIFSDVLEHLYDPLAILKGYLVFLKSDGQVFLSLPNVAVWEIRLKILCGYFPYQDTGALDRTHIRFFTFRTARQLVKAANCEILRVDCTPYIVRAFLPLIKRFFKSGNSFPSEPPSPMLSSSPVYRSYMRFVYPLEHGITRLWKSFLAFRIIIAARKIPD